MSFPASRALQADGRYVIVKKIGRYDIVEVRGKGAMGVVYKAHDPNIDRTVAIKTVLVQHLSDELATEFESRFRAEARAAGKLQHPNIVGVYDAGRDQGVAYIVMEFIQGEDLAEARKVTARQRPDVLLVDLRLRGGRNGIDVIHALRATLGPVPALLISGDTAPDRLTMAANAGLRMCHKPLTMEQLLAELARIQNERGRSAEATPAQAGSLLDELGEPLLPRAFHGDSQLTIPFDLPPDGGSPPVTVRRRGSS